MDLIDPQISRLSNAYIESTHKVNKQEVVKDAKNTSVGDVVRILENRWKDIITRIYVNESLNVNLKRKKKILNQTSQKQHPMHEWKNSGKKERQKGHDKAEELKKVTFGIINNDMQMETLSILSNSIWLQFTWKLKKRY